MRTSELKKFDKEEKSEKDKNQINPLLLFDSFATKSTVIIIKNYFKKFLTEKISSLRKTRQRKRFFLE